ncbi:putative quinol monooxygenase [Bacillus sp. CGMCC 1.16607]|uniref:putative quinol monooxygenase n=1 Tax=Bacillus sp. CGMCC 1.16607 TaxID=3351842 RepID=UPI00363FA8CA
MLVLHAYIKVDPARREEYLQHAKEVMKGSKAEAGCNSYHLYEDTIEPNTFVMVEEWKDTAALEYHFKTEHYQAFKIATEGMLVEPPRLVRYDVTGKN